MPYGSSVRYNRYPKAHEAEDAARESTIRESIDEVDVKISYDGSNEAHAFQVKAVRERVWSDGDSLFFKQLLVLRNGRAHEVNRDAAALKPLEDVCLWLIYSCSNDKDTHNGLLESPLVVITTHVKIKRGKARLGVKLVFWSEKFQVVGVLT